VLAAKRPKNAAHGAIRGEVKAATSPEGRKTPLPRRSSFWRC